MTSFSNLRARLVGTVLVAITPALIVFYYTSLPWAGFVIGLLALVAAWVGGEMFVMRQVRALLGNTERLASGDLASRTGLGDDPGELGQLAREIDDMAAKLEARNHEREKVEKTLLNRSLQQTVVSALGQFALVSSDFEALMNQVVLFVTQTLEVEYCAIFELRPGGETMGLRAGAGWKDGVVGQLELPADASTQGGFTLRAGEPVVLENMSTERRFRCPGFLIEHGAVSGVTVAIPGPDGKAFGVLGVFTTHPRSFSEDEVHFLISVATVLTMAVGRARSEAQLQKLAAFTQLNPNPAMELAGDGTLTYFNQAAKDLALAVGENTPEAFFPSDTRDIVKSCLLAGHSKLRYETKAKGRTLSWSFHPVPASGVVHAYVEDITDQLNLEEQLRHSQRLESVGQLAAGVAHDFNNMLTVIQGHSGMLQAQPGVPPAVRESAEAISFAAERATSLTRQLLMFSRKNVMQPALLDLPEVVAQMTKLLQRLLGETIELQFEKPEAALSPVKADAGMMEQVIMNLAVNARDAMPKGGILRIELREVEVDASYLQTHAEARSGRFVVLQVSDTGCGIDPVTMKRVFEPFFTTKEVGKGTGLGLATVYGIVKQHEGWIDLSSRVGEGTTFEIHLPASDQVPTPKHGIQDAAGFVGGGKETILVVEDESVLRDLAQTILETCGYRVLQAGSGPEALRVWQEHRKTIDLVLTDMVMPEGMSGVDLAQKLFETNPSLRVIFASGYSMDETDDRVLGRPTVAFLQKPYTYLSLSRAVRESLDKPVAGP